MILNEWAAQCIKLQKMNDTQGRWSCVDKIFIWPAIFQRNDTKSNSFAHPIFSREPSKMLTKLFFSSNMSHHWRYLNIGFEQFTPIDCQLTRPSTGVFSFLTKYRTFGRSWKVGTSHASQCSQKWRTEGSKVLEAHVSREAQRFMSLTFVTQPCSGGRFPQTPKKYC